MTDRPFVFFDEERSRFFRGLNSSRRELVSACIRALYERLHGPSANYAANLTKQEFKDLLFPVVLQYESTLKDDIIDELSQDADPAQMAGLVMKVLIRDGWIEQFADRQGLVTAFRLTRAGKIFAESLWSLDRPSRSRQRNMRGCRNSLSSAAQAQGDAHDLVDAFEYAERVIQDLNEATEYLQERVRLVMQEASVHTQWEDFIEFLDRFQREYSKQLTVDSATLNRSIISSHLEVLRSQEGTPRYTKMQQQLAEIAKWAMTESQGDDVLGWMLNRIEDLVCAAHDSKQPSMMKAMDTYIKRITGLVQQSMMLRTSKGRQSLADTLQGLATSDDKGREDLLARIALNVGPSQVRLLDPAVFRMRGQVRKKKATTVSVAPRPTRQSRMDAAVRSAAARAFHLPNGQAVESLSKIAERQGSVRLSQLPHQSATDVLMLIQGVEAVRGDADKRLTAVKLPQTLVTPFFSGADYEISARA